jgi:modulator of FtsH protease HflK
MRKVGPPSEIGRLAAPLFYLIDLAWQRMHWWIVAMAVLYALSGITVVRSDEVAVILRWGKLVGSTPALQEHGPGLLFALPRPIDRVVRVQVKHIWEVPIGTLNGFGGDGYTLDPVSQGYALTGDQNILQMDMVARYRVRDAAEWAFYGPKVDDILRVEVTSAMVRSLGEMAVDHVLADERKNLIAMAARRAQAGLDASHSGLELSSLELTRLAPPQALASDFDAVQSAFIGAETNKKEAEAYAARAVPQAHAEADAAIQSAHAGADSAIALAKGEADAFKALDREYRANSVVVRERLYRDGLEKAFRAVGQVRWVPPPTGGSYRGFRITVPSSAIGAPARTSTSTQLGDER